MLKFQILGMINASSEYGEVRPRGKLQRSLLVTLLMSEGRSVSIECLIDEMWGGDQPDAVENAVHAHVSRLRRKLALLEPDARSPRLITQHSGYRLVLDEGGLDAVTFMRGYQQIKSGGASLTETARSIRKLLGLWQGPIFGGSVGGQVCQAAAARFEETRLELQEMLFDCELETAEHRRIIPELQTLLVEHPYKERFRQQLMVALYRSGRQTDALEVYRALHSQLSEELGLSPSPVMQEYERAVLEQDPVLHSATAVQSLTRPRRHHARLG